MRSIEFSSSAGRRQKATLRRSGACRQPCAEDTCVRNDLGKLVGMKLAPGAAAVAMLMGCSTTLADAGSTLEDTSWQLTEIQSMDDTQGTTAVPDAQRYTVTFDGGVEGETRASFQIDCNRGSGSWLATPSKSGASGQLTFGPIATTQMACPPGSLDQRVSTALAGVRTYLIKDGRLHLSLLADSGILTWQPIG